MTSRFILIVYASFLIRFPLWLCSFMIWASDVG
jgi:hypothetical protein